MLALQTRQQLATNSLSLAGIVAGKSDYVVNEAYEILKDDQKRAAYVGFAGSKEEGKLSGGLFSVLGAFQLINKAFQNAQSFFPKAFVGCIQSEGL